MECEDDIERPISAGFRRRRSSTTNDSLSTMKESTAYRVLVMGGRMVGKTAIISQLMQDKFPQSYKTTVQEMHQRVFKIKNRNVILNINNTYDHVFVFIQCFNVFFSVNASSSVRILNRKFKLSCDSYDINIRVDVP